MIRNSGLSRRQFLTVGLAAGYGAVGGRRGSRAAVEHSASKQSGTGSTREKLLQFPYSDVKLTGGPLKSQFDRVHAAYLTLDEDRVLKVYRQRAGLPAPGRDMGGWYDADAFAPGHCLGQWISGLARFASATAEPADGRTRAKVQRLVEGFAATIGPDGNCYASRRAQTAFPAYMYDKHVIGLLDAYRFAGVTSALDTLQRATQGATRFLPGRAIDRNLEPLKDAPDDESYTLAENLFYAYEVTGKSEYLDMAKAYLLNRTYFEPLARGENVLPHRHAYSHMNALSSAARAYQHLGDRMHFDAIRNAWDMIEQTQQFASGGWGPNESFVEPNKGLLGQSLLTTQAHFETPCGAYAHLKLARYLLRFTGEARYGDGLERVLYNTVLGAKDPSGDDYFFYYSNYHPSAVKRYFPDKWPCCAGTLPQVVADYHISAYFWDEDGIYVNLFTPSEVRWKRSDSGVRLVQTTNYPLEGSTELRLELSSPAEFTVHLRIPSWLKSPAEISVNGTSAPEPAERGTFAAIRRRWQNHDRIELKLPFSFRVERIDEQHPDTAALMYGPLMLVAVDPRIAVPRDALAHLGVSQHAPRVVSPGAPAPSFELPHPASTQRFVPFYAVGDEAYTTYVSVT
jgi:uncharacterized protein